MKKYIKINREAYNLLAAQYRGIRQANSEFKEPIGVFAGVPLKFAQLRFQTVRTLDVGPGSGEVTAYFGEHGCDTTAVDVSKNILEIVREKSPTTKLICADILSYELGNWRYELIFCGALIHLFMIRDAKKVLQKIKGALVPGGILFVNTTLHDKESEGFYVKQDYCGNVKRFRHKYTEKGFREIITKSGFSVLDELRTNEADRGKQWLALICENRP